MLPVISTKGRLTADVQLVEKAGYSYCEFTVANSKKYKETEKKCFLRCKAWRGTAEFISKYFKKGQEIFVTGELCTETWEKDGQTQSRMVLDVTGVDFCGSKASNTSEEPTGTAEGFMPIDDVAGDDCPFN